MHASTYLAIAIRVLIAICTRTAFQPDEYFQSLEPAHHLVFGYGTLTWEWSTPRPIRSIVYPALNVPIYYFLKVLGLAEAGAFGDWLLIALPKVLHGTLAALVDIYVAEIARVVLGSHYVATAFFLSLTSPFHALALSRSLSNSLETSLTTIAFAHYPWDFSSNLSPSKLRKMIIFSALACMIRATNAIIWVFLFSYLFWSIRNHRRIVLPIGKDLIIIGLMSLATMFSMDSLYYGRPTFTPWNFFKTNLSSVSLFYGSSPWHYYLSQAIPILCATALPFTLHGVWTTMTSKPLSPNRPLLIMLATTIWTISVYSIGGHKEWRFLHPILPLFHIFAAKSLVDLSLGTSKPKTDQHVGSPRKSNKAQKALQFLPHSVKYTAVLVLTLPISLYIILFYCSGPVSVLSYFRSIPREELRNGTIGFLMPCHSTPGYSYLHRKELAQGGLWSLGCEPPLERQDLATYKDQTDIFFDSPKEYLLTYFPTKVNPSFPISPFPTNIPGTPTLLPTASNLSRMPWNHEWPEYLAFFGDLLREDGVKTLFEEMGYKEVWKAGREWEGEGKRKGGVKVWKWIH